ncbi:MAG: hypothetical protein ACI841_002646 [Planctomycetota bacterium]|jgi:hypothetical protein
MKHGKLGGRWATMRRWGREPRLAVSSSPPASCPRRTKSPTPDEVARSSGYDQDRRWIEA